MTYVGSHICITLFDTVCLSQYMYIHNAYFYIYLYFYNIYLYLYIFVLGKKKLFSDSLQEFTYRQNTTRHRASSLKMLPG